MAVQQLPSSSFKVYARWRPLSPNDTPGSEFNKSVVQHETTKSISLLSGSNPHRARTWKSGASFAEVFPEAAANREVYEKAVAATLNQVLDGATCNFFAYGHSGSGKTHTIIGYNYEESEQLGLCLSAACDLFQAIEDLNVNKIQNEAESTDEREELGVAIRLYEVRGKCAYDLLNNGSECHIREGPDGKIHVRGTTEMLEGGKVRVKPIVAMPCWSYKQLRETVLAGLQMRATGSSSVHDESSRTHAIIELEVVNREILMARDAVTERESELVPVGKRATDVYINEHHKSLIKTPEGTYIMNPDRPLNQQLIDKAEAEKKEYEDRLESAQGEVAKCFSTSRHPCLGGKFVFVDLAGSEYFDQGIATSSNRTKQTLQEQRQGRQINTDLFALKEVIRARALNQTRIPFRSSPLTMVLRSHFSVMEKGQSAMILTVSPVESDFAATLNTLKYGGLVGEAGKLPK
ncbi:kinesin family member 2/24 [Corynespora cassiicola Philippines]|uniref:Kinesin-like protein n=1 Tax=Corynespora cassiicola Philippines TaxID=1448308 RepID=A0A2T2N7W0_CORCC|nr:kinesin family member 2/24 [Corynespora cassiicola Philippines]